MMTIKVQDLYYICKNEIEKGNGGKKILISSDDEGNSYHELFYGITDEIDEYKEYIYCVDEEDLKNYVILG